MKKTEENKKSYCNTSIVVVQLNHQKAFKTSEQF